MRLLAALLTVFLGTTCALYAERQPVMVFAAASLRGALDEVAQTYDGAVQISYGGSGTMARQIVAGAPADLVVLANEKWMDWVQGKVAVDLGSRINLVANQLVLIGPAADTPLPRRADVLPLLGPDGRLAMGQRDAVPAGIYARQWLEHTGQWHAVMNRLAETDNVRTALALVARGQAPVGIVYHSDAQSDATVRILARIDPGTHSPIVYPAAALTTQGQAFLDHLVGSASQDIFAAHGFDAVTR